MMAISKQDTNKLLTAIDQVTIPIPDLFKENNLTDGDISYLSETWYTDCEICNEIFSFKRTERGQLTPDWCPTCEENMYRVERGDADAMAYYKRFYCSLCGDHHYYDPSTDPHVVINGNDGRPYKVPTIDDVIPDGYVCRDCFLYCEANLVHNKANVKVKTNNPTITASGICVVYLSGRGTGRSRIGDPARIQNIRPDMSRSYRDMLEHYSAMIREYNSGTIT